MNYGKEFNSYATKHLNINSSILKGYENSMTPYILEEREMRATQMDVFSRLLMDRIIWLSGAVDQHMADIIQAQLLFLDSVDKKDISIYVNTPGGSVLNGLGIIDVMNYIKSDVATINLGMAASMGSVILSSGAKGKRSALRFSKVMIHQVSSGTSGHIADNRISQMEAEKYNFMLFKMLAKNCGKTFDEVYEGATRDHWFNSNESLAFGLVDEIIGDEATNISTMLDGFDDYYAKEVMKIKV